MRPSGDTSTLIQVPSVAVNSSSFSGARAESTFHAGLGVKA